MVHLFEMHATLTLLLDSGRLKRHPEHGFTPRRRAAKKIFLLPFFASPRLSEKRSGRRPWTADLGECACEQAARQDSSRDTPFLPSTWFSRPAAPTRPDEPTIPERGRRPTLPPRCIPGKTGKTRREKRVEKRGKTRQPELSAGRTPPLVPTSEARPDAPRACQRAEPAMAARRPCTRRAGSSFPVLATATNRHQL